MVEYELRIESYTNTEFERLALDGKINLSDGHARHPMSVTQREIMNNIPSLINLSLESNQLNLEQDFFELFFKCCSQNSAEGYERKFLTYSSSCAIKIAAQCCRIKNQAVYLMEPCFDNIRHLLETEGVNIRPIQEAELLDLDYLDNILEEGMALWLILPNNPSGFSLSEQQFSNIIKLSGRKRITLIVDFCFRFFDYSLYEWDQYNLLLSTHTSFICIEDTGKTWPIADLKIGMTLCSADVFSIIHQLHDQLLLNVSPLVLSLLIEFIKDTMKHGFAATVLPAIAVNRQRVLELVHEGMLLRASLFCDRVPMELLRLVDGMPALQLWNVLRKRGVDILPAQNYYWSSSHVSRNTFRIPLSRPTESFGLAMEILKETLNVYSKQWNKSK